MTSSLTIPISFFAVGIWIVSLYICIALIYQLRKTAKHEKISRYSHITSQSAAICNTFCCMSVSMYCIWIIFDTQHTLEWFIALRALPTIFWFMSKVSLIWLFNGRRYYTFQATAFESSYFVFISINILIAISAPSGIIVGYVGVWYGVPWLISLGFQGFRFLYILLTFYLTIILSKKMLILHVEQLKVEQVGNIRIHINTTNNSQINTDGHDTKDDSVNISKPSLKSTESDNQQIVILSFLNVTAKNVILVSFITISACLVVFWWLAFDYIFEQNYLTLLAPMNMFAIDCIINSFCIYCLFKFGADVYNNTCTQCDKCCRKLLFCIKSG